jgi:alpha-L-arabinofuranosidase
MARLRSVLALVAFLGIVLAGVFLIPEPPTANVYKPQPESPRHRQLRVESLKNASFAAGTDGWSVTVFGAEPKVEIDAQVPHEGKSSLRISAMEPSDTALGQELVLAPGRWYRLRGWVRTRSLDPQKAPVSGTFQIQMPGGNRVIASGTNHAGDTDWTEETIEFEAPPGGRTRVAAFFVGFGKGIGTAWFADLKIEEVDGSAAPLRIAREFLPGTINPMQYGQFIEYLCDLVPSMWAEKLYDGSFEGLSPYNGLVYLKETDFREHPWHPCGSTNRATYSLDRTNPVGGDAAQRISVKEGTPCTVGIEQDGLAVEQGKVCAFSCYLRQQAVEGPVEVRLHREAKTLAVCTFDVGGEWQKYRAQLVPAATEPNATLSITFGGPGTLWLDNASLMPVENVGGWRPDVVAAVKALKPGVIRFGGSALDDLNLGDFEWKDTIGDPDKRKPFRAWGGLQPTGPGLEEIVQFCRLVGAEPLICVRFSKRQPADAAEQVQYFNGAADTPMGKLRAQNGHSEPYRIKYWQVGNERAGTDYEARLAAFCQAMKEADPTIVLLSSYPKPGVLRVAGALLDYVCPHQYDCANLAACERELDATRDLIRKYAPEQAIKVAVTEWNTTAGDAGPGRAKLWSLENALACSRYHNLLHRRADLVDIANRSNLINSFCSGIIQVDNHRLYKTPTYYAQQLYANHAGNRPLQVDSAVHCAPDVSATLSGDGSLVTLFAVNATLDDVVRPLDFAAFGDRGQTMSVWTLADRHGAGEPDVTNSFAEPERIAVVASQHRTEGAKFEYRFPALSVTMMQWKVAP